MTNENKKKRYYWIKLKDSFFTSDTVDFLMSQKDGANYVVLYQMLCLKTVNTNGELSRQIGEILIPFDIDKIQRDCKYFSRDTIAVALELYKQLGLIFLQENGIMQITNYENMVGSETQGAIEKRKQKQLKLSEDRQEIEKGIENVYQEKDIRDKRLDNRDKNIDSNITNACTNKLVTAEEDEIFIQLDLKDGTMFDVKTSLINSMKDLYRKVDVEDEFRQMKGWCISHSSQRKTRRGIMKFITGWLDRATKNLLTIQQPKAIKEETDNGEDDWLAQMFNS